MKPRPINTGHSFSSATHKIKGRIDIAHAAHVMHQLSDMYPRPAKANVREYATNALDSHIEAGQTRPIEIELPTESNRKFVVRDFGVGLSMADLEDVFLSYGASRKRETDEQTGSLGFGSKAGVAYAPLGFNVIAVKDGHKIKAVVAKDEEGVPEMGILWEGEVDEPNGVTISIPVEEGDEWRFIEAADELFRYWPKGSVLIDGEEPETVREDGRYTWLDVGAGKPWTEVALIEGEHSVVVMGNVPYRVDRESKWGYKVLAYVEMGSVHFTPNREELNYTPLTEATIDGLFDEVDAAGRESLVNHILDAPTAWEKLRRYYEVDRKLNYNHQESLRELKAEIQDHLPDQVAFWEVDGESRPFYRYEPARSRNNVDRMTKVVPSTFGLADRYTSRFRMDKFLIVEDYPYVAENIPPSRRFHLRTYIQDKFGSFWQTTAVLLPCKMADIEFLEGFDGEGTEITTWEELKAATPRPKARHGNKASKTLYTVWRHALGAATSAEIIEDEIDPANGPILYSTSPSPSSIIHKLPEVQVVAIQDRQVNKFKRLYPLAREAIEYLDERREEALAALTDEDKLFFAFRSDGDWRLLSDAKGIEDPTLDACVQSLKANQVSSRVEKVHRLGASIPESPEYDKLRKRYPLIQAFWGHVAREHTDHIVLYVNAVWHEFEWNRMLEEARTEDANDANVVAEADITE